MNRQTKILSALFGVGIAYALGTSLVYPRWIEPLWTLDERIAERRKVLDKLERGETEVREAAAQYRRYVERVGSLQALKVENDVRERLNQLIEKHQFKDVKTSTSRANRDRKTGLERKLITLTGVGSLQSAIEFLKDVAEMPELMRAVNPAIYPARFSRRGKGPAPVNLRLPLEFLILPRHRLVGPIDETQLIQPKKRVRYEGRDYAQIWTGTPLTPYIPPDPVVADVRRNISVKQGSNATIPGTGKGGVPPYTYLWTGPEGRLSSTTIARPNLNTSEAGNWIFTLTVTDSEGKSASSNVKATVQGKIVKALTPSVPRANRWNNRHVRQLCMALMRSDGQTREDEFMVYNTKTRKTDYYAVGSDFDGGELIFVHQRGALVRRLEDYYVYPIGLTLDKDVPVGDSEDSELFQKVVEQHRKTIEGAENAQADDDGQSADGKTPPDAASEVPAPSASTAKGELGGKAAKSPSPNRKGAGAAPGRPAQEQAPTGSKAKASGKRNPQGNATRNRATKAKPKPSKPKGQP